MSFGPRNLRGILAVLMCFAFAVWLWRIGPLSAGRDIPRNV